MFEGSLKQHTARLRSTASVAALAACMFFAERDRAKDDLRPAFWKQHAEVA